MKSRSETFTFVTLTIATFAFNSFQQPTHVTRFRKIPAEGVVFSGAAADFVSGSRTKCAVSCSSRTQCLSYSFHGESGRCLVFHRRVIYGMQMSSATGFQHYWKVTDHCPLMQGFTRMEGLCVRLSPDKLTWQDAQAQCETLGAHLFVGDSDFNMQAVETVINIMGDPTLDYRLGAWDPNADGNWVWVTGAKVKASTWGSGVAGTTTTKTCAETVKFSANKIVDDKCSMADKYVCHVIVG